MKLSPVAPKATFDIHRLTEDMALKGWMAADLARAAAVSTSAVSLFLNRKHQTPKMAAKLASALGHPIRRYLKTTTRRAA